MAVEFWTFGGDEGVVQNCNLLHYCNNIKTKIKI